MTEWTPGEWRIGEICSATVFDEEGRPIADCDYGREHDEANARLIAASPRLYAALEELLGCLAEYVGWRATSAHEPRETAAENKARAALAAARGEDAERKEVVDHPGQAQAVDNASAPAATGADPPWLDEAMLAGTSAYNTADENDKEKSYVRAVLRVANAQPVSEAEVEAARGALTSAVARAVLEAAAKVRAGG